VKHLVRCRAFASYRKNTLRGFAQIEIPELRLTIRDVALHRKGEARWAQPPSKPVLGEGRHIIDEATGKPQYTPLLEFGDRATRDAFSRAVWAAVAELHPEIEEMQ
jgi:hypothetical protein